MQSKRRDVVIAQMFQSEERKGLKLAVKGRTIALVMLGLWFGFQIVNGLAADATQGGVAYWAHAGGFIAGMILVLPLWNRLGGTAFWQRSHMHPPHPEARYSSSRIPRIQRNR